MACEHKHIRSTNCELYCLDCGARLPDDYLTKPAEQAEKPKPKKGVKK